MPLNQKTNKLKIAVPDDVISKIKDRIDVVDLISSYIRIQKSGVNYKARCPFHNEKTGSFFVSPERQIWHCFGCGKGGDIFGFVKDIEGVEFPEALRILATKAGVELQPHSPEYQQFQSAKTKLYEIVELAAKFFEKQLWESPSGKAALEYLRGRGLADESMKQFRLGWAPDSWNAVTDFLTRKYSAGEVQSAGLIIKSEKSMDASRQYYDRFRSRIMFPIFDISGQAVGFSGRIFGTNTSEEAAKYVNTPQTSIYDKSRVLYGLDKARLGIRQNNKCIVVEGNMDVIMSHQAGVTNAVASSGTALTDGHLKIIKRYTDNLDLCFDSDSAGEMATNRGVGLALSRDFNVGIIAIDKPGLKDPADFVQKDPGGWAEFSKGSKPFMQFFFDLAAKQIDITAADGKKLFSRKLLPMVASLASAVEQAHWIGEIATALRLKDDVIRQELAGIKPGFQAAADVETSSPLKQSAIQKRLNIVEESILSIVLKKPELAAKLTSDKERFLSAECVALTKEAVLPDGIRPELAIASPETKMSLDVAYLKSQELWKDFEDGELERELEVLLAKAKKNFVISKLTDLELEIKAAEKTGDKPRLAALVAEFSKYTKELAN